MVVYFKFLHYLKFTVMPRQSIPVSDRQRLIDRYNDNEDFLTLAQELGIQQTTAYSIIAKYVRSGEVEARHGGGRQPKVDNESIDFVVLLIQATPTITLHDLNLELRRTFPRKAHYCDTTIARALDGNRLL